MKKKKSVDDGSGVFLTWLYKSNVTSLDQAEELFSSRGMNVTIKRIYRFGFYKGIVLYWNNGIKIVRIPPTGFYPFRELSIIKKLNV